MCVYVNTTIPSLLWISFRTFLVGEITSIKITMKRLEKQRIRRNPFQNLECARIRRPTLLLQLLLMGAIGRTFVIVTRTEMDLTAREGSSSHTFPHIGANAQVHVPQNHRIDDDDIMTRPTLHHALKQSIKASGSTLFFLLRCI